MFEDGTKGKEKSKINKRPYLKNQREPGTRGSLVYPRNCRTCSVQSGMSIAKQGWGGRGRTQETLRDERKHIAPHHTWPCVSGPILRALGDIEGC